MLIHRNLHRLLDILEVWYSFEDFEIDRFFLQYFHDKKTLNWYLLIKVTILAEIAIFQFTQLNENIGITKYGHILIFHILRQCCFLTILDYTRQ